MIEIFRNWIVALLCLSILIVIIQLVIPKTNLRKYIYTLIGIITVITIISPVVDLLKKQDIKESIADVLSSFNTNDATVSVNSSDLEEKKTGLVKVQFIDSIKQDIKDKLESKNITVKSINVSVDDNYDITKLEIKILKSKNGIVSVNEIVKYLNNEYGIVASYKICIYGQKKKDTKLDPFGGVVSASSCCMQLYF